MLPKILDSYLFEKPKTRDDESVKADIQHWKEKGISQSAIDNFIISQADSIRALNMIEINKNSAFYDYYLNFYDFPDSRSELYDLKQILESYQNPYWGEQYPNITDRYLQISSIEGEGSYFYDKETDAVYDVDWSEMDDFMAGKLKPRWKSFYDFLEWYYGEDEE